MKAAAKAALDDFHEKRKAANAAKLQENLCVPSWAPRRAPFTP
eukprot:COSAG01_NODE_13885_length_1522_cov_1.594519_2_plen_42_part_01